eukprot:CAMPEP_0118901942 /NCGR_PEP_ID=MMETSP1166-20130328/7443_1 /TAXON_ID=1104430 /ORGANISM="Chrysoreinhardia sp, Strain CCMP3193" /LENGTH=212 /DNA_ID=CAMNT_0006841133 /DNA_START=24 /DNA_END=662 /DNA_ORIENTATION=-
MHFVDSDDSDDDGEEVDVSDEEVSSAVVSIVERRRFRSAEEALADDASRGLKLDLAQLDFYGRVRLVNLARSLVAEGLAVDAIARRIRDDDWKDDPELLKPVLEDDALLLSLGDDDDDDDDDDQDEETEATTLVKAATAAVRDALLLEDGPKRAAALAPIASLVPELEQQDDPQPDLLRLARKAADLLREGGVVVVKGEQHSANSRTTTEKS